MRTGTYVTRDLPAPVTRRPPPATTAAKPGTGKEPKPPAKG
jgi:hypothetical protein